MVWNVICAKRAKYVFKHALVLKMLSM